MKKSSLYTRTGDAGLTSLVGGERVAKNSTRLEAYGTIDELSSAIGLVEADPQVTDELRGQLRAVQNMMFNIGSYLATAPAPGAEPHCAQITPEKMAVMEGWIDALDEQTPKMNSFVLPGGTTTAALFHMARTICRRAERRILDLAEESYVDPAVIRYVNRLSDYLFIAARYSNFILGVSDVAWQKDL